MDELPHELLESIFFYLRGSDRLYNALVCRRWSEVVSAPELLKDVRLVLRDVELSRAIPILLETNRRYVNLQIDQGTLFEFNSEFWSRIGEDLRCLLLKECDLSLVVFYSILRACKNLQSLEITGCPSLMMSDGFLRTPENICVDEVRASLKNVHYLSLSSNRYLTDASFNKMLSLMPNITALNLAGCSNLQFHPGIFHRFHNVRIDFSSTVLTFQNVVACMTRSKQTFVDLDFSRTLINTKALTQLVDLYGESLLRLRLNLCDQLTFKAYEAIGRCSNLELLSLQGTCQTQDSHLDAILPNTVHLQHLDLSGCYQIREQGLSRIVDLNDLRYLCLYSCTSISNTSLCRLGTLTKLQHLDLSFTKCDITVFRQLTMLRDLRQLHLLSCRELNDECFGIICDHFPRLQVLNLEYCILLTDEAGTKFHQLAELRDLTITGALDVTDRTFEKGVGPPDMQLLKLALVSSLTDRALVHIAKHHRCLRHLDLSGCTRITDVGLISLIECLPRLRTLLLKGCRSLTDRSLEALHHHCPDLQKLVVELCAISFDALDLFSLRRTTVDLN